MMRSYAEAAMNAVKKFNIMDFGMFKVCLLCFGILVGIYATKTCKKYAALVWLTFGATYAYLIFRLYQSGCFSMESY